MKIIKSFCLLYCNCLSGVRLLSSQLYAGIGRYRNDNNNITYLYVHHINKSNGYVILHVFSLEYHVAISIPLYVFSISMAILVKNKILFIPSSFILSIYIAIIFSHTYITQMYYVISVNLLINAFRLQKL